MDQLDQWYAYRYYDTAMRLLYVGITTDLIGRASAHRSSAVWWGDAAHSTSTLASSKEAAEEMERQAFLMEKPLYNLELPKPVAFSGEAEQTSVLNVRMGSHLKAQITAAAETEAVSVSMWVRRLLEWHFGGMEAPRSHPAARTVRDIEASADIRARVGALSGGPVMKVLDQAGVADRLAELTGVPIAVDPLVADEVDPFVVDVRADAIPENAW